MKIRIILLFLFILSANVLSRERPTLIISKSEAQTIKNALGQYPILDHSFHSTVKWIDNAIREGIEVPPPGEAGGYEHEKHKQNYRDIQAAGLLYMITKEEKYAQFIKNMLYQYAELYPTLGPHPMAHNQAPGMLFHQMLNETVWLLHTSQAYDCIYDWLSTKEREYIERNVFRIITNWFTQKNAREFNRIHNHGTWSVASVGMIGYVMGDQDLIDMALYGTEKDGKGGFFKQLDLLFSPDGYYMEGPYYIRYALRPFFYFSEAIERNQPELKIFEYRNQILKKAYYAAVQTIFPNGILPPINDASRTMNISAPGVFIATNIAYYRYGSDPNILGIVAFQDQVLLNGAGLKIAQDFTSYQGIPNFNWPSVEFTDGFNGKQGGLGILRNGTGNQQTMLLMKYGVHGEGHGHFDKLNFLLFHQKKAVIPDYGFARWINIEPKFGGRYLPENKSYAMTTVAHNTVVVDELSQNNGNRDEADQVWGERHFFDASEEKIQVMSALANRHYEGVAMQRTMFLIDDNRLDFPVVVDFYRLSSEFKHQYDYLVHFDGQLIHTSFEYNAMTSLQVSLGEKNGYQHLWKEAEASIDGPFKYTWLDGNCYYSWVSTALPASRIILARTGATDPYFNLRSEPLLLLRSRDKNMLFASVFEPHGYFNEAQEKSVNARGSILELKIIGHNEKGSIIEIYGKNNLKWRIIVNNGKASPTNLHEITFNKITYQWTGNYKVELNAE